MNELITEKLKSLSMDSEILEFESVVYEEGNCLNVIPCLFVPSLRHEFIIEMNAKFIYCYKSKSALIKRVLLLVEKYNLKLRD